jgi:hypothetical protein
MPDMSAIGGALSSLNTAMDIAKTMIGLRDGHAIQSKLIELNTKILDAQKSAFAANDERAALIGRIRLLEKELVDLKAGKTETEQYDLTEAGPGMFAYIKTPAMRGTEPAHYVCANCYRQNKISILQHMQLGSGGHLLSCSACNAKNLIQHGYTPPR